MYSRELVGNLVRVLIRRMNPQGAVALAQESRQEIHEINVLTFAEVFDSPVYRAKGITLSQTVQNRIQDDNELKPRLIGERLALQQRILNASITRTLVGKALMVSADHLPR
jgi:hypothetical protein